MIRRASIALTFVALASAAAPDDDHKKLQGTWVATWLESGDFSGIPKGQGDDRVGIRFMADQFVEFNGKSSPAWERFTIDATKKPKQLNLTYKDVIPDLKGGPLGKTTLPCIYEIDGDELRICMGATGRPRSFVSRTDADSKDVPNQVIPYRRVRPRDPDGR